MSRALKARGRLGIAVRNKSNDIEARRCDLAEAKITDYVEQVLENAPPLTDEARARLRDLFKRPAGPHVAQESRDALDDRGLADEAAEVGAGGAE